MNINDRNYSTAHIVLNRFSAEEKKTIKQAISLSQLRRPAFYHDAIVAYSKEITNAAHDSKRDSSVSETLGGSDQEADGLEHDSTLQAGTAQPG